MELLPGRRFEISSHFMPSPRSSMMRASSSGDHLLCFFAGGSDVCGGMLRFPLALLGRALSLEPVVARSQLLPRRSALSLWMVYPPAIGRQPA